MYACFIYFGILFIFFRFFPFFVFFVFVFLHFVMPALLGLEISFWSCKTDIEEVLSNVTGYQLWKNDKKRRCAGKRSVCSLYNYEGGLGGSFAVGHRTRVKWPTENCCRRGSNTGSVNPINKTLNKRWKRGSKAIMNVALHPFLCNLAFPPSEKCSWEIHPLQCVPKPAFLPLTQFFITAITLPRKTVAMRNCFVAMCKCSSGIYK